MLDMTAVVIGRMKRTSNVAISCRMSMTSRAALRRASAEAGSAGIFRLIVNNFRVLSALFVWGRATPCWNALHVWVLGATAPLGPC
jgi:hypothetical protein